MNNPCIKLSWRSLKGSLPAGKAGWQTLKVYDILANEVATLVGEFKPAGRYEVEFNASQLSSGIYFYRLQTESFIQIKKMVLIR